MDILDRIPEARVIIKTLMDNDLVGRKVYFDNVFYYVPIENDKEITYIKKDILYITIKNSWDTYMDIIFNVDDIEFNTNSVDRQVLSIVYLKLQDYVREYDKEENTSC